MAAGEVAQKALSDQNHQPQRPSLDSNAVMTAGGVASADGTRLIIPRGKSLCVYGTATGEKVSSIGEHRERVTAVARDPSHPNQVYTASLDGTVKLWDIIDGDMVNDIDIGFPVYSMVVPQKARALYLTCHTQGAKQAKIRRYDLVSKKLANDLHKVPEISALEASPSGELIAATSRHTVNVWKTSQTLEDSLALHHTKRMTCCALDPSGDRLAIGDATGRILLWHGLSKAMAVKGAMTEADCTLTTVHWHSAAVGCICFSSDGNYMLSGGSEAVLVIWQLRSGTRTYLPRLGGGLRCIHATPDPTAYLITQSDNTMRLVNTSTMKVDCSVYAMLPPPRGAHGEQALGRPILQPGTSHLVMPAENAVLQFYDAIHDRHVMSLQVAPRNPVSWTTLRHQEEQEPNKSLSEEARVEFQAFSSNADWLATAEVRPFVGQGDSQEWSIKFWERVQSGSGAGAMQTYIINTRADAPHHAPVTCLAYHPSDHIVVTGSADGDFSVWMRQQASRAPGGGVQWNWRCRSTATIAPQGGTTSTGGKHHHQIAAGASSAVTAAAFSYDGSLLALGCSGQTSLWRPESNSLVACLPCPGGSSSSVTGRLKFTSFHFLGDSPFLAGIGIPSMPGTEPALVVWNLLTLSIWWSLKLPGTCSILAGDPASGHFAVVTQEAMKTASSTASGKNHIPGFVMVFDSKSCFPIAAWRCPSSCSVASLAFAQPGSEMAAKFKGAAGASPLLLLTDTRDYSILGTHLGEQQAHGQQQEAGIDADGPESNANLLESIFGAGLSNGPAPMDVDDDGYINMDWSKLMDAPSHALPLISDLCPVVLESMLLKERQKR